MKSIRDYVILIVLTSNLITFAETDIPISEKIHHISNHVIQSMPMKRHLELGFLKKEIIITFKRENIDKIHDLDQHKS